jgi:SNF2 family DNA or RNA helicase
MSNWVNEFDRWAPSVKLIVYKGVAAFLLGVRSGRGKGGGVLFLGVIAININYVFDQSGTRDERRNLQTVIKQQQYNCLLTTYDYVIRDKGPLSKVEWKYLIIDEGHRIKNKDSKLTTVLATSYKGTS